MSDSNSIRKIKHLSFNKETEAANIISDDQVEISAIPTRESIPAEDVSIPVSSAKTEADTADYTVPDADYISNEEASNEVTADVIPTPSTKTVSSSQKDVVKVGTKFGFGSLFNREQEEIGGAKRVMQKSILFLVINLICFVLMIITSIGIFNSTNNILIASGVLVASLVLFTAVTNVFFIILSNRLYLLALLVSQVVLIVALNALTGQGLSIPTAVVTLLAVLMTYLAYLELEKNQLSSRIFNVSHIATESTRILTTASILLVCLGLFNYIVFTGTQNGEFEGAENFVAKTFLSQNRVVDGLLVGISNGGRANGINNFFMSRSLLFRNNRLVINADSSDATFKDFLRFNYKSGENLLPQDELDNLNNRCIREKISPCDQLINQVRDQRLEAWRVEGYGQLTNLNLNSPMNLTNFREVTKQFYQNLITDTGRENAQTRATASIPLISNFSPKYIVPMLLVFVVFLLLMIVRPVLNAAVIFLSWVIWNTLKLSGFAKIEVETVESEVVSI